MSNPKYPIGSMIIDASIITPVELSSEQIAKLTKVRIGFSKAVSCLGRLKPEQIEAAGISAPEVQRALVLKEEYDLLEVDLLPVAEKLVEILRDTKRERGHRISIILGELVAQARRRAARDPKAADVLGTLSDLVDYITAPANKAAATRTKNAKNEAEEASEEADEPEEADVTPKANTAA